MSLVRNILESFNDPYDYGSEVSDQAYAKATVEGTEVDYELLDALQEMVNIERVVEAADVMGSMTMLLEGTDVSPMMENIFSRGFERLVDLFTRVKNAVVAWFKKVWEKLTAFFTHGKEFVSKYGSVLKSKDTSGFTYSGYVWTKNDGDKLVDDIEKVITGDVNMMVTDLSNAATTSADKLTYTKISDGGKDYIEDVIGRTRTGKSIGEMKTAVKKAYRNGKDSSSSDLTINSTTVADYLGYIETGKDMISTLKKAESDFEKQLNAVIKTLNSIKNKSGEKDDTVKNASAVSKTLDRLFTIKRALYDAQVASYREMLKAETAILRKLLSYSKKSDQKAVQNSYYSSDLYELFAAEPMLESDDLALDEEFIEECDDFSDGYGGSSVGEGTDLYTKIETMLGI